MNTVGLTLTAYYNLINGQTAPLDAYKLTVPAGVTNYIWIYPESGSENNTKSSKSDDIIICVQIITTFENDADQTICETADTIINELIIPQAGTTGLISPAGLQILNVKRENYQYLIEGSGTNVIYRKNSRYSQRVHQT